MTGAKTNERPGTRAQAKYVRVSASKAREVLNEIRGLHVADAADVLDLSERGVSDPIAKVLDSAVSNAEHNDLQDADELFVSACFADEGPTFKRWRPRARGRATRINKRTCHITVIVSRMDEDALELRRNRMERRLAGASTPRADRAARVARSRGEEVPTDDEVEELEDELEEIDEDIEETTDSETADEAIEEAASDDEEPETDDQAEPTTNAGLDESSGAEDSDAEEQWEGSHAPLDDGSMPEGYPIKGNANSMKYHQPDGRWYENTVAEVWFADVESAEAAGFTEAGTKADAGEEEG